MNRNSKSHFSATDNRINIGRSRFDRSSWWKGTMATGSLVPFYIDECLPGDSFDMKTSVLCRMATPLFPVMDNAYLDTYFFFVPNRLVWDHWQEFNGENDLNAWVQTMDYEIPGITFDIGGLRWDYEAGHSVTSTEFSLADYFGLPTRSGHLTDKVSSLPFRAYQLIWNEWFRDQNLQDPILIPKGDSDEDDIDVAQQMMSVRPVNKFHDYFTSCLPAPQKGSAVLIPGFEGSSAVGTSPVVNIFSRPLTWSAVNNSSISSDSGYVDLVIATGTDDNGNINRSVAVQDSSLDATYRRSVFPNNLVVAQNSLASIDALRFAFQLQKLLWRDGNGGSRYTEIIRSHFGVVSPDARLQRPEYLGGKRIPITVNQVIQTSSTDNTSPQGNTAAVSKTVDSFNGFTKSFTEHGFIVGVCCIRTDHTYQNGINRMWSRKDRFDFYWPEFAHIGEQAVLNKEIYFDSDYNSQSNNPNAYNKGVFGYQEAWAEYRYRPSFVTGAFRSNYSGGSLDAWHYADDYDSQVYLSGDWIVESPTNVARTLAVTGRQNEQWLLDFYFDLKTTRPMPVYSVPGLVDHF